ncbi:hypothetical protein PS15m_000211 [Mucor circinelloides]
MDGRTVWTAVKKEEWQMANTKEERRVVVIFAINGSSSVEAEKEFVCVSGSPFLKVDSRFWAKDCPLISQSSIDAYLSQTPLDPIVALGYFLTTGSLSLNTLEYKQDHTVQQLYQTSYKLVMAELKHKNESVEPLQSLLEKMKKRIENSETFVV